MDLSDRGFAVLDDDSARLQAERIAADAVVLAPERREAYVETRVSILKNIHLEIGGGEGSEDYARRLTEAVRKAMARRAA